MSTNINPDILTDTAALEKLANQFFKAFPGTDLPGDISAQPAAWHDLTAADAIPGIPANPVPQIPGYTSYVSPSPGGIGSSLPGVKNIGNIPVSDIQGNIPVNQFTPQLPTDSSYVPPSIGGIGASPSGVKGISHLPVSDIQGNFPVNHFATGKIPASVAGSGISPSAADKKPFNISDPQTSLPDPHFGDSKVPASVAGGGISPSALEKYSPSSIPDPQKSLTDSHVGDSKVSQSVAGKGISPSVLEKNTSFNVSDPQTSLPDPHFTDGKVPSSVAGSGRQPSLQKKEEAAKEELPYSSDYSFQDDLQKALSSFNTFMPSPQLPGLGPGEVSYYFLQNKNDLQPPATFSKVIDPGKTKNQPVNGLQSPPFDANLIKKDFPILSEKVNGKQIIWLDNAATTQKPKQVIDRISYFYEHENSNVHRAAHELAARSTDAYEGAREKVRRFLNAKSTNEIVFVRGATEAINLVAKSWGEQNLNAGDEIIISHLEHHANIVPWQQLAEKKNLKIKVIPVDDDGQLLLSEYSKLLGPKTKLVAFSQVSNALGTITPAAQIAAMAHAAGAKVLIDGAQSVSHMRVDVQSLGADWFVFSGHKIFAPTGIGVLYGREELLNDTQPWQGGGNMIADVTFEHTKYQKAPGRFEAGTGSIADAVGLGAAIDYVTRIGIDLISQYEHYLLLYATARLHEIPGLRLIGTAAEKASVLSFVLEGFTNDEVGQALNKEGIAVRTGHHCAQPILRRFGVESTVRPSLAFYNSCADVDALIDALLRLQRGVK